MSVNMSHKHAEVCVMVDTPVRPCTRPLSAWYQRAWCRLRCLLLPCAWHHGTKLFLRSLRALEVEKQRQLTAKTRLPLIHPYSSFSFYWNIYTMLVQMFALLYMPLQVFYLCPPQNDAFILFCDAHAVIAILFNFLTGWCDRTDKVVILDHSKIAKNYLKHSFFLDVISCLPLQCFFAPFFTGNCNYPTHTMMFFFKLFRLFAVMRVYKEICHQVKFTYLTVLGTLLLFRFVFFFHWMTFLHFQIPLALVHLIPRDDTFDIWLRRFHVIGLNDEMPSVFDRYVSNLYYVFGLCIGTGEHSSKRPYVHILAEHWIRNGMGLVGVIFVMYMTTCILRVVLYKDNEFNIFNGRLKELQDYMSHKKLPRRLQQKINLYVNYRYSGHFYNERAIMETINQQIKQEINMNCCKKLVARVPLFQDMPIALLNTIIFSLKKVHYMPGQVIIRYGRPGKSIYLISSGTVVLMDSNDRELGHLKDGSYFGERCLLQPGSLRSATIVALEITEIYKLTHEQLEQCIQPSSRLKRRLHDMAQRIEENYSRNDISEKNRSSYY